MTVRENVNQDDININVVMDSDSERIAALRERTTHCVCRFCGEPLSLCKITYAAYDEVKIELYCEQCGKIEYGTEKEIYAVAEYFVDELGYDHYPNIDPSVHKKRMNVASICDIISWGFKNTGLLDDKGFKVDLDISAGVFGEATLISESELNKIVNRE